MNEKVKQIIVVRKDLNMRKGKIAAQSAHASFKVFLDQCEKSETSYDINEHKYTFHYQLKSAWDIWLNGRFTKVVAGCDSEIELLELYNEAKANKLPCSLITDAGLTEFNGVPTRTCIAIGPDFSDKINLITGHLKLL